MPTVLRIGPYRFFFYAGDRQSHLIFMSNVLKLANSGSIPSDYSAVGVQENEINPPYKAHRGA